MARKVSVHTIEKYTHLLKELIAFIEQQDYRSQSLYDWMRQQKVSANYASVCRQLGFISGNVGSRNSPVYHAFIAKSEVSPAHGRLIAEKISGRVGDAKNKKNQPVETLDEGEQETRIISNARLAAVPDNDLIEELTRRGYRGKIEKVVTVTKTI